MRRSSPTIPPLIIKETIGDIALTKKKWIALSEEYEYFSEPSSAFIHPFFGG